MKNKFISNLFVAFLAQGISLAMSMLMSLLLPRMLGVNQYSYSQLFIFYVGYVGFFHFGVNDGLYLKLGGQDYSKLDYRRIGTEYKLFVLFEIIVAIILGSIGAALLSDWNRQLILTVAMIYMVLNNIVLYLGYVFQAVNETKWFSYSVMIDRVAVILFISLLLLFKQNTYVPFIITYSISKGISLAFCIWKGKRIVFSKLCNVRTSLKDLWNDASIGIKLTVSNIVSMLILGVGRMMIDNIWGIESFGKISLSFSLTNFFLVFIQQVSMVMFPALRQIGKNQQKDIFISLRMGINIVAPIILVLYIPMQYILEIWLPAYHESLVYLAYLLPLCIFDGKMQMLFTTYFKVLRQEKKLMYINFVSLVFSFIFCGIGGYVFRSMLAVIISMVAAVVLRSIISDLVLTKMFGTRAGKEILCEFVLILAYIFIVSVLPPISAFIGSLAAYVVYLIINSKGILLLLQRIKTRDASKNICSRKVD